MVQPEIGAGVDQPRKQGIQLPVGFFGIGQQPKLKLALPDPAFYLSDEGNVVRSFGQGYSNPDLSFEFYPPDVYRWGGECL